jgi:uncharacterized protein YbcI
MSMRPERSGEQLAAISNAVVGILRECYGRGPTKAKTYINDNFVFTVTEDIFTVVEETLIGSGEQDLVRRVRLAFQEAVADRFKEAIEEATGRRVLTYHSQVTFEPAMGFEIFVLEDSEGDAGQT